MTPRDSEGFRNNLKNLYKILLLYGNPSRCTARGTQTMPIVQCRPSTGKYCVTRGYAQAVAEQGMSRLWPAVQLAQALGAMLGPGALLFRTLPPISETAARPRLPAPMSPSRRTVLGLMGAASLAMSDGRTLCAPIQRRNSRLTTSASPAATASAVSGFSLTNVETLSSASP